MQLQIYSSQITKIYFAVPTASNTAAYGYCQQYRSKLPTVQQYTATVSSSAVVTANSKIEFYMGVLFRVNIFF